MVRNIRSDQINLRDPPVALQIDNILGVEPLLPNLVQPKPALVEIIITFILYNICYRKYIQVTVIFVHVIVCFKVILDLI